jgi:hypothetical protein
LLVFFEYDDARPRHDDAPSDAASELWWKPHVWSVFRSRPGGSGATRAKTARCIRRA